MMEIYYEVTKHEIRARVFERETEKCIFYRCQTDHPIRKAHKACLYSRWFKDFEQAKRHFIASRRERIGALETEINRQRNKIAEAANLKQEDFKP